ncbi:hypothetical protein EYF80_017354 [Liparis tanakae]|uniref:Uncharacterized protein n=1 Tax=Liparis tanakae TaxID=230148 RepID=A0A4Z2I3B3_9TELE|nr:hypothetical protein EYF80_017354 [Liparis tanakae]
MWEDFWMMQLVVPEALSFPCAKLVKAMAALISLQYVSSLPFALSFCAAPPPPLPLMVRETITLWAQAVGHNSQMAY